MVWGIVDPSSFGEFFPNGDYVGWEEQVKEYYDRYMSSTEKSDMGMSEKILYSKFSRKFTESSEPLRPQECPKEFMFFDKPRSLGSLIKLNDGLISVNESLRNIIEEMEPGLHQFWPIRLTLDTGEEVHGKYYGLVIRRHLDSFIPEESENYRSHPGSSIVVSSSETKKCYGSLAVSRGVIGEAHLWRERKLRRPEILLSDELQQEIARQELRIPKHYKLKVI